MKHFAFVLALAFLSATAFGQKVNFSGDWKLNEDKSELGYQFSLAPESVNVTHAKKTFDMKTLNVWEGQEIVNEEHFSLDGKECENKGFGDTVVKSTAVYDKKSKTIKIVTNGYGEGIGDWTSTEVISMKDGNLVIAMEAASEMGELVETYVFDKQ